MRKFRRLMSRMAPLPPSDCTCALDGRAQELPAWGWVGEVAREGVGMSMCLRVCVRKTREHAPNLHTHPQEVRVARVKDQVLRDEEEVAGRTGVEGERETERGTERQETRGKRQEPETRGRERQRDAQA